jgi:hypothetical protein
LNVFDLHAVSCSGAPASVDVKEVGVHGAVLMPALSHSPDEVRLSRGRANEVDERLRVGNNDADGAVSGHARVGEVAERG